MSTSSGLWSWKRGERGRATVLAVVMLGALAYPLRQNWRPKGKQVDGFPLSYYPMFSAKRADTVRIHYPVGFHADGTRRYLPHGVLGDGGLNQVRRQLNRVVAEQRAEQFVQVIAVRVGQRPDLLDVVRVEIVRGEVDIDVSFTQRRIQAKEEVLASADVPRLPDPDRAPGSMPVSRPVPDSDSVSTSGSATVAS